MKKSLFVAILLILTAGLGADETRNRGRWSESGHGGWSDGWECSGRSINFSYYDTFVTEEELMIPLGVPLEVVSSQNGGIKVTEGTGSSYRIRVCKAVGASDGFEAKEQFPRIRIVNEGGRLTAEGPDEGRWLVHFFIEAPRGAKLGLVSYNGPISVHDFSGELNLEVHNGPIGLRNVSGVVRADAQNGPISLSGGSGDIELRSQNGPLSISLDGTIWQGRGLTADSSNGPLTIKVPSDYQGLTIESAGRSPINCDDVCDSARTRWSRDHMRFEFGSGEPLVRVATRNGPLSIHAR